ncbi:MAG: glutamate-5-semialdehyde dehydrogenase [Cyanobacteria bacterium RYN_339]|nr:glutamate-5-semialdehyde dehydrogenase [Cyanobacteria bacterium RYN_339]
MTAISTTHRDQLLAARAASEKLAVTDTTTRRAWLIGVARCLEEGWDQILEENKLDLAAAREAGIDDARLDRMTLDSRRIAQMAAAVREIASQSDPLEDTLDMGSRPSGIHVWRVRSPLGLIAMIYEARPNVTIDAAALAVFAGNAIVLRPGKEIRHTARILGDILRGCLIALGLPGEAVTVLDDPNREWFQSLLGAAGIVDLLIPRGGEGLVRAVQEGARVPVLAHATGVCHTFIDAEADVEKAVAITVNGKAQRPGVCNATEGLLIDRTALDRTLPALVDGLVAAGVKLHGSEELAAKDARILPDGDAFRGHEWLSLDLTVQVVDGVDDAIAYIRKFGSGHTEAIVTENGDTAAHFIKHVQASAVMFNASTRFNDGGELGLGAEIGISTSRLHAWGPMGAQALTTQRWVVTSKGAVRP